MFMSYNRVNLIFIIILSLLVAACSSGGKKSQPYNPSTVISKAIVEPGQICPAGGIRIDAGIDENRNGILDANEVDSSEVVCHGVAGVDGSDGSNGNDGSDGLTSLIKVTAEASNPACVIGRRRIEVGIDLNRNQILDNDEIEHTEYFCPQFTMPFDGLVFTENPNFDSMLELYAAWPTSGAVIKLAAPRFSNMSIEGMTMSPDKTHVAYFVKGLRQIYIADLLQPYSEPVRLTEGLPNIDRVAYFAWSPDSRYVAFTASTAAYPRGNTVLYSAVADGSGLTQLTPIDPPPYANVNGLTWSPDSRYIAFRYDMKFDNFYQLFTVKPDGSDMTLISDADAETAVHSDFAWAPDSSRVAFMDLHKEYLYTALPTGGIPATVSETPVPGGGINFFLWAPTSKYIAFESDYLEVNRWDIFATSPDKADVVQINRHLVGGEDAAHVLHFLGWSHDGSLLAYVADENEDEHYELYVATPTADRTKVSAIAGNVGQALWSPAKLSLYFETTNNIDLYLVDSSGGNHRKILTADPWFSHVSWSPNGEYLVYMLPNKLIGTETLSEIFIYDVKQSTSVSVSPNVDGGYWPISNDYLGLEWSPDSSMLAFKIIYPHPDHNDTAGFIELYTVFADGSGLQNLTVQSMPDTFEFERLNLGVDDLHFQGNDATHNFLASP